MRYGLLFIFAATALAQTPCTILPFGPISSSCLPPSTLYADIPVAGNLDLTVIAAPTVAPTVSASGTGILTGTFYYAVTFVAANGGDTGAGTFSSSVTASSNSILLSGIPLGPNGTVGRNIYRTYANGTTALMHLVATLADNATSTYTDNSPDSSLGALLTYVNTTGSTLNVLGFGAPVPEISIGQTPAGYQWYLGSQFNCTLLFTGPCVVIGQQGNNSGGQTVVEMPGGQLMIPFTLPTSVTATPSTSGGTVAAGTYFYTVCVADGNGGKSCGQEVSATTTGSTSSVSINWNGPANAPFYQIFRRSTTGTVYQNLFGSSPPLTDNGSVFTLSGDFPQNQGARNLYLDANGKLNLNGPLVSGSTAQFSKYHETLATPASSSAACSAGDFGDDANYHYVCTATNTWKRVALTTF